MSLEGKSSEEIEALAKLADDVLSKPDTAGVFQRLVKKNNPTVHMPLVDLEDRAVAAFGKQAKEIVELKGEVAQTKEQIAETSRYEAMREAGIVSSRADYQALIVYAGEQGFLTTEMGLKKAAMHRENERERAEPTPSTSAQQGFTLGEGDVGKAFMKDPTATARSEAQKAMDELRKQRGQQRATH